MKRHLKARIENSRTGEHKDETGVFVGDDDETVRSLKVPRIDRAQAAVSPSSDRSESVCNANWPFCLPSIHQVSVGQHHALGGASPGFGHAINSLSVPLAGAGFSRNAAIAGNMSMNLGMSVNMSSYLHQQTRSLGAAPQPVRSAGAALPVADLGNVNEMLAADLSKLSLKEQEVVQRDIIGQFQINKEEPAFVQQCLKQIRDEIALSRKKSAYDKAAFLSPGFVNNDSFLLMFLRAECFNALAAAQRVIDHFEVKASLFGGDKLVQRITLKDLDDDDKATLLTGCAQMFHKDKFGRLIFCIAHKHSSFKHVENKERVFWYLVMSAYENDVQAQRTGATVVVYTLGCTVTDFYSAVTRNSKRKLDRALPIRIGAMHLCLEEPLLQPLFSIIIKPRLKETKLRIRVHFGSHMECQYLLRSYGIPSSALPVDQNGNWDTVGFCAQIERIQYRELESEARDILWHQKNGHITQPTERDILLGRGIPYQSFAGNLALTALLELYKPQHDSATRSTKTAISAEIVDRVQSSGGRFLKRTGDGRWWETVSAEAAREKVAMGFRNLSRKKRQRQPKAAN